jgi:hypothetical protein
MDIHPLRTLDNVVGFIDNLCFGQYKFWDYLPSKVIETIYIILDGNRFYNTNF